MSGARFLEASAGTWTAELLGLAVIGSRLVLCISETRAQMLEGANHRLGSATTVGGQGEKFSQDGSLFKSSSQEKLCL